MKTSLPIFISLILLLSCKDKNATSKPEICGVRDPVRNLPWLRDLVEEAKKKKQDQMLTLTAVKLGDETIVNYYLAIMSCIGCVSYRCDGSRIDLAKLTQQELVEYQNAVVSQTTGNVILWPEK